MKSIDILVDGVVVGSVVNLHIEEMRDRSPFYEVGSQNLREMWQEATVKGRARKVSFSQANIGQLFVDKIVSRVNQKRPFDLAVIADKTTYVRNCWVSSWGPQIGTDFNVSLDEIGFIAESIEYPKVESTRPDLNVSGEGVVNLSIKTTIKHEGKVYGHARRITVNQERDLFGGTPTIHGSVTGVIFTNLASPTLFDNASYSSFKEKQTKPFNLEIVERYAKFGRPMEKTHTIYNVKLESNPTACSGGVMFQWRGERLEVGNARKV